MNKSQLDLKVSFRLRDLVKQRQPGNQINELVFRAYAPDRRVCAVTVLQADLKCTKNVRAGASQLLLTYQKPVHAASRDSIRRWTRDRLLTSEIDTSILDPTPLGLRLHVKES